MLNKKVLVGCLVFCGVLLLLYAATITIIFALQSTKAKSTQRQLAEKTKCETTSCVRAAAQIVNYINESIDPCENFYQFANGHYINEMSVDTEDWDAHSFYFSVTESMNKKIGQLLKEPSHSNEWKPIRLAKSFYKSCLNQSLIVRSDNQQLIDLLLSYGGWPAVQGKKWSSNNFDLIQLVKAVRNSGIDMGFLFDLDIYVDPKNKTKRLLSISKGNYENSQDDDDDYKKILLETPTYFVSLNDESAEATVKMDMDLVWAFERKLMVDLEDSEGENGSESEIVDYDDASADSDESDDYEDNVKHRVTTIKEFQELYPYLNWLDYINAILPSELHVTENEPIVNGYPIFFDYLGRTLKSTSNRTLANYIIWRAVYSIYQMETEEIDKKRRDACIDLTSEKFSIPVAVLYSHKYFNETSRVAVVDLVEDVRQAFINMLDKVSWMDNDTQIKAKEKAETIVAHVAHPNEWYKNKELEDYYNDLEMEPNNFFHNSLKWNLFNINQKFNNLRTPPNRTGWQIFLDVKPNEANAFYELSSNTIQFPVSILHENFFAVDRPNYFNYATLGNTVGHEITHGFDDDGRKIDLNGNSVNWWNSETKEKFIENSKCFVQQYSNYTDNKTGLNVDGEKTLNENIADNGGVRSAYYAYQNWIERNGPEKLVPGIKYNQKQLFWIAYAQTEYAVFGEKYLKWYITDDAVNHSPKEFRVNGLISNSYEFAKDFDCPRGTKMNPVKKCQIW